VDTKLKTGNAESLREPLMKIAQKLLISEKSTFEQLTTTEHNLWTKFENADIYRFLIGEEDMVPEFQYNWTSIPRLQPLRTTLAGTTPPAVNTAPPVAPKAQPPAPASHPDTGSSVSTSSNTPHSLPTPSTSGTRPRQAPSAHTRPTQPDLYYVDLYADMLEKKIDRMKVANKIRIQLT
jgi:hypothetical protein